MNIIGLDALIFGVDDVAACTQYLIDYGLDPVGVTAEGGRFEALDGTSVVLAGRAVPALPAPLASGSMLRKTVYGVADQATLEAIAAELGRDREVRRLADGSLESHDDSGFVLGFQVTVRRPIDLRGETVNGGARSGGRQPNQLGVDEDAIVKPRTLSHVVYFDPDIERAERFYVERLGFRCTDRLLGAGPFLQPAGMVDHHALFMIQTPPFMQGLEHLAFHMKGPTELMLAGHRLQSKGYETFWGPGRHNFGSNWFWYFNSPLGVHMEYDADMDKHDADWQPRSAAASPETSQLFLFEAVEKWYPNGKPA